MPVEHFFEGPAGCGKTTQLMSRLEDCLCGAPLGDGQRVLALTFMNGSRRRLDTRLRAVAALRGRYHSVTLDHVAWQVRSRWRLLARVLGQPTLSTPVGYESACDLAGALLEQPRVATWMAAGYPVVVLDEAQDLVPERLRMLRAIAGSSRVLVAADEFQCLSQSLRPNPTVSWLQSNAAPAPLVGNHRTADIRLREAADNLREGRSLGPCQHPSFALRDGKKQAFSAWLMGNALRTHQWGTAAVISPTRGAFARGCLDLLAKGPVGSKQRVGPYRIPWEAEDAAERAQLIARCALSPVVTGSDAVASLAALGNSSAAAATIAWVERLRDVGGRTEFSSEEIFARLDRAISESRRHVPPRERRLVALTIHQAKNREFDGVVVLWGFDAQGDAEQKRRLLYNAVTRARNWCEVIVQGGKLLEDAPFRA